MEVSEIFLYKSLGQDIYNLSICRAVLQNYGILMHYLPNVVHVNLYVFGLLPSKSICGYLNRTLIVTKYDCGQSTTNLKL